MADKLHTDTVNDDGEWNEAGPFLAAPVWRKTNAYGGYTDKDRWVGAGGFRLHTAPASGLTTSVDNTHYKRSVLISEPAVVTSDRADPKSWHAKQDTLVGFRPRVKEDELGPREFQSIAPRNKYLPNESGVNFNYQSWEHAKPRAPYHASLRSVPSLIAEGG